jgi:hypothetical protein
MRLHTPYHPPLRQVQQVQQSGQQQRRKKTLSAAQAEACCRQCRWRRVHCRARSPAAKVARQHSTDEVFSCTSQSTGWWWCSSQWLSHAWRPAALQEVQEIQHSSSQQRKFGSSTWCNMLLPVSLAARSPATGAGDTAQRPAAKKERNM